MPISDDRHEQDVRYAATQFIVWYMANEHRGLDNEDFDAEVQRKVDMLHPDVKGYLRRLLKAVDRV